MDGAYATKQTSGLLVCSASAQCAIYMHCAQARRKLMANASHDQHMHAKQA